MTTLAHMPPPGGTALVEQPEHPIEYLSPAAQVSMADQWFEIASTEHFWVRRRFEVLRGLVGGWIGGGAGLAEIGCGHGLLQRQMEDAYGASVTGFDLNDFALKRNVSRRSRVCCYDIFQRDAALRGRFDVIFLFDVLEHIAEPKRVLDECSRVTGRNGGLVISVPGIRGFAWDADHKIFYDEARLKQLDHRWSLTRLFSLPAFIRSTALSKSMKQYCVVAVYRKA